MGYGRYLLRILTMVVVSTSGGWIANPSFAQTVQTIRIVADPWPPFGGSELPKGGISLDVIATVLRRAGYDVETVIVPWQRALDGVKNGTYDVLGNIFYSTELAQQLAFSAPFFETEVRFMQRRGANLKFSDLDSLRPYEIAVGAGYLYESAFDAADYLQKTDVTEVIQGARMVASGRVDLTLDSIDVLEYIINTQAPEIGPQVEILPNRLTVRKLHMAVRLDLPERNQLISDFNRVLKQMREEGALDELLAKHRND
jgi:polar amino acid transport system substrate-binding protein